MSLLTLFQLNLLLAAAPALAGWILIVPLGQPMLVRAACVPAPVICREAAPISSAVVRRAASQTPGSVVRSQGFTMSSPLPAIDAPFPSAEVLLSGFAPFPHAARAP